MARIRVPGQNPGFPENVPGASGGLRGLPLSPPVPLVGPLGPQRAKSRPSASRAPRAPLLTPTLGPGPCPLSVPALSPTASYGLLRPPTALLRPLWRPKSEDSSIKMKGFGSNLFDLMELSSFFGRNRVPGGFPGVLRAAGTFSGQKRPLEGAGKNPIWPESNS